VGADTLSIIVKLSDGSVGNINYFANGDRRLPKERIEVYGNGQAAVLDDFRALEIYRDGQRKVVRRLRQDKGFAQELAVFANAVRTGAPLPVEWRSLFLTTQTTLKIEAALRSGQPERLSNEF
jgi:predicted dehydrogenase